MRLHEAMAEGDKDPERAIPINAGRCEARSGTVFCGERARWWRWHQFRCSAHKDTRR